jgi:radical SAM protein with 4Fe4S-binding SPASM domain
LSTRGKDDNGATGRANQPALDIGRISVIKNIVTNMLEKKRTLRNGGTAFPEVLDIHPVMNLCNMKCRWCIGGRNQKPAEPMYMDFNKYERFISSIFNKDMDIHWPTEIHICGNNSEPLLNYDFIKPFIESVSGKSVIKLITNGILLHKCFDELHLIDRVSISLDCFTPEDFTYKKYGGNRDGEAVFHKITDNIRELGRRVGLSGGKTKIFVTFVMDGIPDLSADGLDGFIKTLIDGGVNHIHYRKDFFTDCKIEDFISETVIRQRSIFGIADNISCKAEDTNLCIKYNDSVMERGKTEAHDCVMTALWPTVAADGRVYPCAHTANAAGKIEGLGLNTEMDYYEWFGDIISDKKYCRECAESHLCPSVAYYINRGNTDIPKGML